MSDTGIVRTSPRPNQRPQHHTLALWRSIAEVAAEFGRMSVRQLYYHHVSRGVLPQTETAHKRVADPSVQMRPADELPYRKFADLLLREGVVPEGADGFSRRLKLEIVQHLQERTQQERYAA